MAANAKTPRSFGVLCPNCMNNDTAPETLVIALNGLSTYCACAGCSTEFTPAEARDRFAAALAAWERVVAWIESAPAAAEAE